MDPDDNFSPPLGGLNRGMKLKQMLSAFRSSDKVTECDYHPKEEDRDAKIVAALDVEKLHEGWSSEGRLAVINACWWNVPGERDWWEYRYAEILPKAVEDSGDEDSPPLEISFMCGWIRQENEKVDGLTYYEEFTSDGWEHSEFETQFESPRPLTRAVIDTYLPETLQERFS